MVKSKSFYVAFRIDSEVSFNINAENIEEAIKKGKEVSMRKDILQKDVEWVDGDLNFLGAMENDQHEQTS